MNENGRKEDEKDREQRKTVGDFVSTSSSFMRAPSKMTNAPQRQTQAQHTPGKCVKKQLEQQPESWLNVDMNMNDMSTEKEGTETEMYHMLRKSQPYLSAFFLLVTIRNSQ